MTPDDRDLRALLLGFGTAAVCVATTYAVPALGAYRPWLPGDPLPVLAALAPRDAPRIVEDDRGELVEPPPPQVEVHAAGVPAPVATLPPRPPGVATPLSDAEHRGMDAFYRALAELGPGRLARVAHYGDSTIAADGITSTVRTRLQSRFGNGGPGYLSAGMDPRWNIRSDVRTSREGTWDTVSLLLGGGGGRYGYGGITATAEADGYLVISGPKLETGPLRMSHFELWYQAGAEKGNWWSSLDGKGSGSGSAAAASTQDRLHAVDRPEGFTKAAFGAAGGPVTFYGVVMETGGPGVVWDALGVVGVGSRSFTQYNTRHFAAQVAQRKPDLVVLMLGGNELGLPVLSQGDGAAYAPYYREALHRVRAGAPDASCLVVTPLDQATREGGSPRTKPNLVKLVAAQRKLAADEGCAFWNAFEAMGGSGSIVRWSAMKPAMAWTDLLHLSGAGLDVVGQLLADAIEAGYDDWTAGGGTNRPVPAPPGPAAEVAP